MHYKKYFFYKLYYTMNFTYTISPIYIEYLEDIKGIERAYNEETKNYIFGDTLYIAGTTNCYDVFVDCLLPLHLLNYTKRYQLSEDIINNNENIKRVIGHSLGAAIVHNLIRDNDHLKEGIAIGSPNIITNSYNNRLKYFRHVGDPISICNTTDNLDEDIVLTLNPHTYKLYKDRDRKSVV